MFMRTFALAATVLGIGMTIGFYAAVKLEERYILKPLNAYVDLCVKQCEEEKARFKVVSEGEDENEL